MKHYNKLMLVALLGAATVSCADDKLVDYKTEKPESIARYEYLNAYDALKSYITPNANPDFKLGAGISVSEFIKGDLVYAMAASNFTELTAGNAMKYASCVKNDGSMDFDQVFKFVQAAKTAGLTIYGHTLAWHSQQNNKYLNSLIADKELDIDPDATVDVEDAYEDYSTYTGFPYYVMGYTPEFKDGMLVSKNPGGWYQYFVADNVPTVSGREYKVTALIKGSTEGSLKVSMGGWSANVESDLRFTTEWKEQSVKLTVPADKSFVIFKPGTYEGEIQMKWLKVSHSEAQSVMVNEVIRSFDFEDGQALGGWGNGSTREVVDLDGSKRLKASNPSAANFWSAQMAVDLNFEKDVTYYMSLKIKGSAAGTFRSGAQITDGYKSAGDFPNIAFTTEWQEREVSFTCNADGANRWIFSFGDFAGDIYIDDLTLFVKKAANSIPLSPEEKKTVLTGAMDKWIAGMMETCEGYVTAWDVVNEPISGVDKDGDGIYDLQSATRKTVSDEDAPKNFYWQDYLGDEDYVRIAVAKAREHFAANGGNAANLKLFINDYNLESDWDDNKKLKSLIEWIKKWEADDVTKIDGIGTQMHVSYYMDAATQKRKEDHIVKMLELLAASGKLVKISELDMGIIGTDGASIKTENVTFEQQKLMADFYTFIIKKYFEIIPKAQQYGITQWATTDSPAGSGWREGQPIGLWDLNYNRKPTYAGFVEGLK